MPLAVRPLLVIAALAVLGAPSPARAADTCNDAFEQSQVKRLDGRLVEARSLFRACSSPACSPTQQKLCAQWFADAEARVPSFVLAASDGAGGVLVDVGVLMDGVPVKTRLDSAPVDANPGPHRFLFVRPDGAKVEAFAVAEERVKGKLVTVTFATAPPPVVVLPPPMLDAPARSPLRTIGLVTGAVGVGSIALGAVFGGLALATKGSDCPGGACQSAADRSAAYTQGTVSTVGFIVGGVFLASGLTLVLLAPKSGAPNGGEPRASVSLSRVGPSGGALELGGVW